MSPGSRLAVTGENCVRLLDAHPHARRYTHTHMFAQIYIYTCDSTTLIYTLRSPRDFTYSPLVRVLMTIFHVFIYSRFSVSCHSRYHVLACMCIRIKGVRYAVSSLRQNNILTLGVNECLQSDVQSALFLPSFRLSSSSRYTLDTHMAARILSV